MPRLPAPVGRGASRIFRSFRSFGFAVHSQRGSHIKMRRAGPEGATETLTIPAHHEVKIRTLHAIFLQALCFIPEGELGSHFYTD